MTERDAHLAAPDVLAHALGALDETDRARIEAHLATCPACAERVRDERAAAAAIGAGLRSAADAVRPTSASEWRYVADRVVPAGGERRPLAARLAAGGLAGVLLWAALGIGLAAAAAGVVSLPPVQSGLRRAVERVQTALPAAAATATPTAPAPTRLPEQPPPGATFAPAEATQGTLDEVPTGRRGVPGKAPGRTDTPQAPTPEGPVTATATLPSSPTPSVGGTPPRGRAPGSGPPVRGPGPGITRTPPEGGRPSAMPPMPPLPPGRPPATRPAGPPMTPPSGPPPERTPGDPGSGGRPTRMPGGPGLGPPGGPPGHTPDPGRATEAPGHRTPRHEDPPPTADPMRPRHRPQP